MVCGTACTYTANCRLSTLPNFGIDERKIEKNKKLFEVMNFSGPSRSPSLTRRTFSEQTRELILELNETKIRNKQQTFIMNLQKSRPTYIIILQKSLIDWKWDKMWKKTKVLKTSKNILDV